MKARDSVFLYLPIQLFTMVWIVTIGLFILNPFNIPDIKFQTWFIIILGLLMIYTGFFTSSLLSGKSSIIKKKYQVFSFEYIQILKRVLFVLTTLGLIGIIGKIYLILNAFGGIHEFISRPGEARYFIFDVELGKTTVNPLLYKLFSYFGSLIFITTILGGVLYTFPKSKLISIYPLFVSFIAALYTLTRGAFIQNYIFWLIAAFLSVYYHKQSYQRKAFKIVIRQGFYFVLIFFLFSLFILILRFFYTDPESFSIIFNSFYFYIAGNIVALDKYIMTWPDPLYGISIFRSIINWFYKFGLAETNQIMPLHYEFYYICKDTTSNTFTYIRVLYEDFNIYGVIILSYIWGFLSFIGMKFYIKEFSLLRLGLASMVVFSLFWSFYGFFWIHITHVIWRLILFGLIGYYINNKVKKKNILL